MALQFCCPCEQAKLLEADESLVGQVIQCPFCELQFVVPVPAAPAGEVGGSASAPSRAGKRPSPPQAPRRPAGQRSAGAWQGSPSGTPAQTVGTSAPSVESAAPQLLPGEMPGVVHLACPNGHELETPRDLLGTDIACPVCGVEFRLRREDTDEYRAQKRADRERKEQQFGRKMMNFSIVTAVLVVLAIIMMALYIGLS
ncbi:MAG: hypothetical protein AB7U73_08355 [Pirellulales bacterium]